MAKENPPNKFATAKRHNDGVRKKLEHASGLMSKMIQVKWLYLDTIYLTPSDFAALVGKPDDDWSEDEADMILDLIFECFKLGDKLLDVSFKNSVIDAMIRAFQEFAMYPSDHAQRIYEGLPESSTYRRLYLDMWAWESTESWYTCDDGKDAPGEFYRDLAKRQQEIGEMKYGLQEEVPWISDPCQYHEHPEGTPKCSKNPAQ